MTKFVKYSKKSLSDSPLHIEKVYDDGFICFNGKHPMQETFERIHDLCLQRDYVENPQELVDLIEEIQKEAAVQIEFFSHLKRMQDSIVG